MGAEVVCKVHHDGRISEGKALLETEELIFRGGFRLRIPFRDITKAEVHDELLRVATPTGVAEFALGNATAEKWLQKLLNPKSVLDKLGVKAGMNIAVLGIGDADFLAKLGERVGKFDGKPGKERDCIIWGVMQKKDLAKLPALEKALDRAGGIWVIWPKGRPELREDDIRAAAISAGLVDVKVMKFSETHSGLRLVIPKARR
jgi:hypothetical protein